MMNKSKKYVVPALAILVGVGTISLFQNCSSGSLPTLDQQQSASTTPPAMVYADITAWPVPNPVPMGTTAVLNITGGNGNFTISPSTCGGTVTKNVDGSYSYAAPATAQPSCVLMITDTGGRSFTLTFAVTAPATTTPPPTTTPTAPPSVQIYETIEPSNYATYYGTNQNQFSGWPGTAHHFLASDGSAGAKPFFRCKLSTGYPQGAGNSFFYLDTQSTTCENQPAVEKVQIGYIYSDASMANTRPLYRYWTVTDLLDGEFYIRSYSETFDKATADASGRSDGVVGYVPIN